jgi:hypothetical protein
MEKSNTNLLPSNLQYYEIILNDRNSWLNLSDSYLEIRAKLTQADGATVPDGLVAPISDIQNVFRRAEAWIENKSVQTVEYPGVCSHVLGLVKNSPDYDKSGSAELYYPDRIPTLSYYTGIISATVGGAPSDLTGTGADPHILQTAAGGANVILFLNGEPLTPVFNGAPIQLVADAAGPPANVTFAGAIAGNQVFLRDKNGNFVEFQTPTGLIVDRLVVDATPALTFADGNATAVVAGAIQAIVNSANENFAARKSKFTTDVGVYITDPSTFYIPLRKIFSFWDYNRHVWKGATHRFRFDRDTAEEYIYSKISAVNTDRLTITYMSLWMPVVVPNDLIAAKLNKQLADQSNALADWYDYEFYENNLITNAASTSEVIWRVTSKTERVVRIYAWMQRVDARSSQLINKGVFGGFDIKSAQCSVNGVIYPRTRFDLNPGTNFKYTRLYNEYLRAGGHIANPSTGATLSIEEWAANYQIICFDLSYQPDVDRVYTGKVAPSDIEIRVQLNTAYGVDWRLYAILQTERYATLQTVSDMIKML